MQGRPNKLNDERLPPYMSYRTWQRLLTELSPNNVPSRFDHSYFENLNIMGSSRSIAKGTFQFLGLISSDGLPTPKLHQLAKAEGTARGNVLAEVIHNAYEPLFSALDVTRSATHAQLREFFRSQGVSGDIERKCLSFFFALASDASIPLSPHLKKPSSQGRGKRASVDDVVKPKPGRSALSHADHSWEREKMLIEKFPAFDPAWADDVKKKWFDAFMWLKDLEGPGLPPSSRRRKTR